VRISPATTDLTKAIEDTVDAKGSAVVFLTPPRLSARFFSEAIKAGAALPARYGWSLLASSSFLTDAGPAAEGTTIASLFPNRVSGPQANSDLIRRFKERFGRDPSLEAPAGYVAAFTYFEGVRRAGDSDAATVAKTLHAPGFHYDSMIGVISYDDRGDVADAKAHIGIVKAGRLEAP
jgi:ABC-type branched-subunit amino acid transport system substrate-binding protein